ncbi:trichodiene synthase [Penicillium concentricum]|uniref:Trichodiene synthase n=1 Tax=Penicillium concentricum TaxID=293559 RepID=A0A9W9UV09_9EURO|nr:trichodiene synthase [Penicillium concentricum]KAJ5356440.1 trichodiene synthase [Penicillium concentricum]
MDFGYPKQPVYEARIHIGHLQQQCAAILEGFLSDASFTILDRSYDTLTIKTKIQQYFDTLHLEPTIQQDLLPFIDFSAYVGVTFYPHATHEIQAAVGIFNTYATVIDDKSCGIGPSLRYFTTQLASSQPQKHPFLQHFQQFIKSECPRLFGPFAGDMILKSVLDFISISHYEMVEEERGNQPECLPDAPLFAEYVRLKSGLAETYAYFVFPENLYPESKYLQTYMPTIPYLRQFIDYTNDILSFYKEELAGERFNFIHNSAQSGHCSTAQSLEDLCKRTIDIIEHIRVLSSKDAKMLADIEQFIQGYILMHLGTSRYRLVELALNGVERARECLRGKIDSVT